MIDTNATIAYPILKFLPIIWPFLIPTLLYFFVQHISIANFKVKGRARWLFIPFIINFTFQLVLLFLFYFKPKVLNSFESELILINKIKEFVAIAFCLIILVTLILHLKKFQEQLKDHYAELSGKSLAWLSNLIKAILVLWILWAIPYSIAIISKLPLTYFLYPFWIGISVLIYWIGYSTFSRDDIFETVSFVEESIEIEEKPDHNISEAMNNHYERLKKLINEDKIYIDPNLDMTLLAKKMDLSNGYLSQIINQKEGKNFFNFINEHRVEAVKEKLQNPDFSHYSVLGIALECGFNSKSTFNAVFKKITGKTPSSFRKL